MKQVALKIVKGLAESAIKSGENTMCMSLLYQPKMPDQLRKKAK